MTPTDARIPLGYQPPQIQNPMQQQQQVLQTRDMQLQNQMRVLQVQQTRQDMQDQATMRQAFQNAQGDLTKLPDEVHKLGGVGPRNYTALMESITKIQQGAATLQKTRGDVDKLSAEAVANEAAGVLQLPMDQRAAAAQDGIAKLAAAGHITPTQAQAELAKVADGSGITDAYLKEHLFSSNMVASAYTRGQRDLSTAAENQQKTAHEAFVNAGGPLGAASTKDDYARQWYGLPSAVASRYPHPDTFDPARTPQQVRQLAMSPEQQAADVSRQATTAHANAQTDQILDQKAASVLATAPSGQRYGQMLDDMYRNGDGSRAQQFEKMVPRETFDPASSPAILRRATMTPAQQQTGEHQDVTEGQGERRLTIEQALLDLKRKEHEDAMNNPGRKPGQLTQGQSATIETNKNNNWMKAESKARQLLYGTTDPDKRAEIYANWSDMRQEVQNAYENEIAAAVGHPVEHVELPRVMPRGQQAPAPVAQPAPQRPTSTPRAVQPSSTPRPASTPAPATQAAQKPGTPQRATVKLPTDSRLGKMSGQYVSGSQDQVDAALKEMGLTRTQH
jgi:hypothetical protein